LISFDSIGTFIVEFHVFVDIPEEGLTHNMSDTG